MNWKLGDSIGIKLDQINDMDATTQADIDVMLAAIREAVEPYGFKVREWGEWTAMRRSMMKEEACIQRYQQEAGDTVEDDN